MHVGYIVHRQLFPAEGGTMWMKRLLAAVAVSSGALLGALAPVASAEVPGGEGVYTYLDNGGVSATWTIRTTCTPQCVAQVTTAPGYGFSAPLVDGRPTATRTVPDGVTCPAYQLGDNGSSWDGGTWPVTVHQSWDPRTLRGEVHFVESPSPCGIPNPHDTFTLTRIG
jgi:hypothetical protein